MKPLSRACEEDLYSQIPLYIEKKDVGVNETPSRACEADLPPQIPLYIEKKDVGVNETPSRAWRWTPTPESVGCLLKAVAEIPDVSDILELTATTDRQMAQQFNRLLKRFGLSLKRVRDGERTYYTLTDWAERFALMGARRAYVDTLTVEECEIVQWLQVEARRRVLVEKGWLQPRAGARRPVTA